MSTLLSTDSPNIGFSKLEIFGIAGNFQNSYKQNYRNRSKISIWVEHVIWFDILGRGMTGDRNKDSIKREMRGC
jgi:hypothetical protein